MDKEAQILIKINPDMEHATITINGLTTDQSSYLTPRLLKLMDDIKNQQVAQY